MMKKRLLILCTGNSCRSQMAEGIARKLYGGSWDVFSAGTHPSSVNPYAIRAMDELNIDISTHTSDSVNYYLDENIDLIITVCDHAASNCPIFQGKQKRGIGLLKTHSMRWGTMMT